LRSPDGREVSVSQALDEIERGAEVVLAEIKAKSDAKQAEIEAKEKAEQAAIDKAEAEYKAAKSEAIQGMIEVEKFPTVFGEFEIIYRSERNNIRRVTRNGVACTITQNVALDGNTNRFYCADPVAAGLTPITPPESGSFEEKLTNTFDFFFGD